jgi:hypothetical protein
MFKVLSAALLVMAFGDAALAADYDIAPRTTYRHRREAVVVDTCHARWCRLSRQLIAHRRGCPDRYSCYGLYDAYGPYGGRAYLGAYTRLDAYTRLY